jgi:hypothetical protein
MAGSIRAKKLTMRGYDFKLPPPHLGRPPLFSSSRGRNTGQEPADEAIYVALPP